MRKRLKQEKIADFISRYGGVIITVARLIYDMVARTGNLR
jgi:hypothetical protein